MFAFVLKFSIFANFLVGIFGQVARDTSRFYELFDEGVEILEGEIQDHPDVRYEFDPSKELLFADTYSFVYPDIEDYRIGILMDPVSYTNYFCVALIMLI